MLDLNYVRENIDKVREALQARRADTSALDDFARAINSTHRETT
jgi:seryl-tRNA synthetase